MNYLFSSVFSLLSLSVFAQIQIIPIANPNKIRIVDLVNSFDSSNCNIQLAGSLQGTASEYYVADAFYCTVQKTAIYTVYYKKDFRYLKTWDVSNVKQLDSQLVLFKNIFPEQKQRLDYVKYISDSIQSVKDKEEEGKARVKELQQKKELDSLLKVKDALLKNAREKNLVLVNWTWGYENEYSSSADFHVKIVNPYMQRMKYVSFTFSATNPVGDPALDRFTGKRTVTLRGIGPVEYSDFGEWDFKDAFYSRTVESFKITVIKIQFFDGTVKVINNPVSLN